MAEAIESNPAKDMVNFDIEQILAHAGMVGIVDGVVERHNNIRVRFEDDPAPLWIPMEALLQFGGASSQFEHQSPQFKFATALCHFGFQLAFHHMLDGGFVERG